MAKIYWLTGQPGVGKTEIGKRLFDFVKTDRKNWRKSVFHIDGDHLRQITTNVDFSKNGRVDNIKLAQNISKFLYISGCDVIVSLVSPYRHLREIYKSEIGSDLVEIYLYTDVPRCRHEYQVTDYEPPLDNYISLNTSHTTVSEATSMLIHKLKNYE